MKFFVEKETFSNELKLFQGVFEKKSLMDILQNIKLTVTENGILEMVATDLEISMKSTISVDVQDAGTFTLNGKDFYELISKMPDGFIEISEENDLQIKISNPLKSCQYILLGLQSIDYPELPEAEFSTFFNIELEKFNSMIYKIYYIISPEMKFNLGGALFSINQSGIEMVSTDGHRLSFTSCSSEMETSEDINFIISRKTLLEISKFGQNGDVKFSYDKNNLFFKFDNHILSSRIIDQKFPNYRAVIPLETKNKAILEKEELFTTLRRALIFKTRNNGIFFKFRKNKLILERVAPEKGESHDEIEINYNGEDLDVAFNGGYIVDFLSHCDSNKIEVSMNDSDSSFIFQPLEQQKVKFTYVAMPLNI